ncbi:putative DNA binding protein [Hibiscus syriacus]|uniref:DNA binding protein n=1 Tax=Hibiscus syriacus TaxID=106335 RepID=A0A6A3CVK2_HIBSY|nr:putative DNA binding protein [Hibiscus syriacus]
MTLGILSIPSLLYFALMVFYLPESPRWLVSKGKMLEAKQVLQRLRGREDVSGEMALLVEGLGIGGETSIEEYIISPVDELGEGQGPSGKHGEPICTPYGPVVTLFGSVHDKLPETGSNRSTHFLNFGSMFSTAEPHVRNERWDEESSQWEGEDYAAGNAVESVGSTGIGGGWQLAWKWSETEGNDMPAEGEFIQAAALVSQSALYSKELKDQPPVGPAMVHPAETASKGPVWAALLDPGVKSALFVGVGIQILQQFSTTLPKSSRCRRRSVLSKLGLSSNSASFLISAFATLLMLPCIGVAMKLMDISGRRRLLLTTIPVVIVSLIILVFSVIVKVGAVVNAAISTACVMVYLCFFVMGYGPIPNILCSEIFPTRVRGLCIAICVLVAWIGDIVVSYHAGHAQFYRPCRHLRVIRVVCVISWVFVFVKVPETKGMPLEVITEFFAVCARQTTKNE